MPRKIWVRLVFLGLCVATLPFLISSFFNRSVNVIDLKPVSEKITPSPSAVQIGGDFSLTDQHGKTQTPQNFRGKVMVVYFGYSYCPDICPMGLVNLSQALNLLKNQARYIQPLFITVDPERDTVKTLSDYMQNYDPRILALTGDRPAIDHAIKAYKVYAKKIENDGVHTDYLMDHTSIMYVMNQEGHFVASFNHATPPKKMVEILKKYL